MKELLFNIVLLFHFISPPTTRSGEKNVLLQIDILPDENLEIERFGRISSYENKKLIQYFESVHNMALRIISQDAEDLFNTGCVFTMYRRNDPLEGWKMDQVYECNFQIWKNGAYQVPEEYLYPNIRSIPIFPEGLVSVGDIWKAPVEIKSWDASKVDSIQADVSYLYKDNREILGRIMAVIQYEFKSAKKGSSLSNFTNMWSGEGIIHWDIEKKRLFQMKEVYKYKELVDSTREIEHVMTFSSRTISNKPLKKQDLDKIQKELEKLGVESSIDKSGLRIYLGEVNFDHNSDVLKNSALQKILEISKFLEPYKDYHVSTEGHTDDKGSEAYNQNLSEKRAKRVADAMKKNPTFAQSKRLYAIGYGKTLPRFNNDSEENRLRNRRVEIVLHQIP